MRGVCNSASRGTLDVGNQSGEDRMIEPARVHEFSLARDPFELKVQTGDDSKTRVIRGCGSTPDSVNSGPLKRKVQTRGCRLSHVTESTRILA